MTDLSLTEVRLPETKPKRRRRNLKLIADFHDGFAVGWHMAVPDCFKECLDICLTERVKTVKQPDGSKQKFISMVLTQGSNYAFARGDTFYDCREAYSLPWSDALHVIQQSIKVLSDPDADGVMAIQILRPNSDRTALVPYEIHDVTPESFVTYLQSGVLIPAIRPDM